MGVRKTSQREAIRNALARAGRPLGPAELHAAALQKLPRLGIATVYRAIKDLLAAGELASVEIPGQPLRYEPAGSAHHHHFHCRGCNRTYCLGACTAALDGLTPAGFRLEGHEISLHGLCRNCAAGKKKAGPAAPR